MTEIDLKNDKKKTVLIDPNDLEENLIAKKTPFIATGGNETAGIT